MADRRRRGGGEVERRRSTGVSGTSRWRRCCSQRMNALWSGPRARSKHWSYIRAGELHPGSRRLWTRATARRGRLCAAEPELCGRRYSRLRLPIRAFSPVRLSPPPVLFTLSARYTPLLTGGGRRRPPCPVSFCVLRVSWRDQSPREEGSYQHLCEKNRVEVAGIEPASFDVSTGLLRAQPAIGSRAPRSPPAPARSPSRRRCPRRPVDKTGG